MTAGRPVHHRLDIYGTELHLAFDRRGWASLRRMNPTLSKAADLGLGAACDSRDRITDEQHVWIWIDYADGRHTGAADVADTIAHEATHVALNIFQRGEMAVSDGGTSEPFAYLVGWLTGWIWRNLPNQSKETPC